MTKRAQKGPHPEPPFEPTAPTAAPVAVVVQSMELTVVQTALTNMNRVNEGLAELQKKYASAVFDCTTEQGMAEAKAARKEIAAPRIEVEKIRVAAKRPILDLGKKLDGEAARITEELEKLESPIDAQIKAEENRIREEQEARIREEAQRVSAIQQRIADIRDTPRLASLCMTSAEIHQKIEALAGVNVDDSFAEFADIAAETLRQAIDQVKAMHAAAREREAEQARLAEQRAELDRRAAEQAERDRQQRERDQAEQRRVAALLERVAELRGPQTLTASSGSAVIGSHIFDLENRAVDESFSEYRQQAEDAKASGLARLRELHVAAIAHEAELDRQEKIRAALEAQSIERIRVDAIQARLNFFNEAFMRCIRMNTSQELQRLIAEVEAKVVDATFAEFEEQAREQKETTLRAIRDSYQAFVRREEEERQRAERERQEREDAEARARAEEEERDRIQREREAEEAAKQTEEAQRFEREGPPKLDGLAERRLEDLDFAIEDNNYSEPHEIARVTWYMRRWAKALQITTLVGP